MTDTLTMHSLSTAAADRRKAGAVTLPHVVNGQQRFDGPVIKREDPSQPSTIISICHDAPDELVLEAVAASRAAQREWAKVPVVERAEKVRRGIAHILANEDDWAVRLMLEVGKTQERAGNEVQEILEFVRRYPDYISAPGAIVDERDEVTGPVANQSVLRPYGVFAVITPFNFPFALSGGPALAAVLTGNGVVIKSAEHAPWSVHAVYEMFEAMDLPTGLVNIVHGADGPGKALVSSDADGISFVGSAAVGSAIIRQVAAGPYWRPVIAEMGGKNPVIVTDSADVQAAADGIVFSAFDQTGQKCSALSRVLATPGVYDELVSRVTAQLADLKMADPIDPESYAGPLVTTDAVERFGRLLEEAQAAGFTVAGGGRVDDTSYLVNAAVIADVPEDHDLARTEHFLPLVTISKVDDFNVALEAANAVPVGLSAGIFTGDRAEAASFLDGIEAGCIDVNVPGHATTGWFPGPQTFGGWKGSGSTGKHAYGKWYVHQFAREQARKVSAELGDLLTY